MATSDQSSYVIGVDIGGTKVAAGFVDHAGEITHVTRVPMVSDGDAAAGLTSVVAAIDSLLAKAQQNHWTIRAVGICAPGPLDPNTGVVINPPNVTCWRNFPLAAEISSRYHLAVKIENDANAAALAEFMWGAGKGYAKVFYISIGTGIGTGLILDGHIYNGRTGAATEGGHVSIDYRGPICGCGKRGCIEVFISGTAIAKRAQAKLEAANLPHSPILDLSGGKIAAVTCELVNQAYASGDPVARATLLETVELLAVYLGNTIDLLEPDVIVVGGGVAGMLQPFFDELREHIPSWCV